MEAKFHPDFEKVKAFTLREVGSLDTDLLSRDSYAGMCPYMNLIHTLTISPDVAQISFAAPLAFNKEIKAGKLVYNDLFPIYLRHSVSLLCRFWRFSLHSQTCRSETYIGIPE